MTRQYDLLRPRVGQKASHQDSAVRFVTAKPERATKTGSTKSWPKEPPRLGSTICYGQTWARKSHQDSAVRFVTAKRGPSAVRFVTAKSLARKSHQDSAVRFVTAKRVPEKATKTRQYDLLRPRAGQKEPPRLGSTICYGQKLARKSHRDFCYGKTWARKSHQDSAVRFVTAKRGPERATETRQHDLLRPNVGQKEPPRLGSTICYGQTWARKSHQDSAVRFVTAKSCPERATKTRQYDLIRPNVGQKEPPRLGSTICYGQAWARKSHQDSAVRFVAAKSWPEKATKTRQYDLLRPRVGQKEPPKTRQYELLRPNVGQKEPPRLGSTICYGQELARKSHQDSAVRFVTAKRGPDCYGQELARKSHQDSAVRFVTAKNWPEKATKTRQYDFLRPNVGQKEPPRLGSTICYGQTCGQKKPPRLCSTICYGQDLDRKSHQDSAVRFVAAKRGPERATKTRQCYLLRPNVGQKEPSRLGSTLCYGQTCARKSHPRLGSTICYSQELARKSHQDSAVRFVTVRRGPERATKTRQYDLLRPRIGQKEPPRLGSTISYGQTWARKSHRDSTVRFVTAKRGPERDMKTRQYDLLRPRVGQKEPPRLGSTICYGQDVGQKEPPRLGSTICCGQTWARKSHQDSAVRFVTAKRGICYGQKLARKNHQDSAVRFSTANRKSHRDPAVRFVAAKRGPERATKTRQYDLLRPRVGQKEPPRLGSTICYGKTWARKSHQDSAVRFITAKRGPERATETRQYDLLRPNVGQKEPPRLDSTICYGQTWARKRHEDSAL